MAHETSTARGYEDGVDTDMHLDRPLATKLVWPWPASPRSTASINSTHNHTLLAHLVSVKCLDTGSIFLPIISQKNLPITTG